MQPDNGRRRFAANHSRGLRRDTTGRNLKEKTAEGGPDGGRRSRKRDCVAQRKCPDAPARSPQKSVLGLGSFPPTARLVYAISAVRCSGRLNSGVFYP